MNVIYPVFLSCVISFGVGLASVIIMDKNEAEEWFRKRGKKNKC